MTICHHLTAEVWGHRSLRSPTLFGIALALLLIAFSPIALGVEVDSASPGLVKDKPAAGRFVETDAGYMVPYEMQIPGTDVTFEMLPIPGGKFKMGSAPSEAERRDDEGPQHEVVVEPFWMAKYEITWSEYKQYMALHDLFKAFITKQTRVVTDENRADAITAPSNLYDPSFTFESGDNPRQPAVTMSQYAAKQYTKWLSSVTGQFYRLPGEAEWEYACRAGTETAYSFGDDPAELDRHGWYHGNSDGKTQLVGQKEPNPWGLYDMHGNAAEWVLDFYTKDGYKQFEGQTVNAKDVIVWPTALFPRVVRGGSFDFNAARCRSAARYPSEDNEWRDEDPNIPLSPWWFTTAPATGVGFRIIRPLHAPQAGEEQQKFWKADIEDIQLDVDFRIEQEGRGALGIADKSLPAAIKELKEELSNGNN